MSDTNSNPGLDSAIEACADSQRLYLAALDVVGEEEWKQFLARMALHRETLLHRLRFLGGNALEQQVSDDLVGWRGRLGEISLSLKGLLSDQIKTALATIEPADTRLVECLGAIGIATPQLEELAELQAIIDVVTVERDTLRHVLDGSDDAMQTP